MRLKYFLTVLFLSAVSMVVGQELPEIDPSNESALVYFLRGKGHYGSATGFSAIIDEERVCNLSNRRFSAHLVAPGTHEIKVQFAGKKGKKNAEVLELEMEAGKTYYLKMDFDTGVFVNDLTPEEITRSSALRLMEDDRIEMDKNCAEATEKAMKATVQN